MATIRRWAFAAVFLSIFGALAYRLQFGVDLSDESYYAIFVEQWVRFGIPLSTFLTTHQTAALIALPFAHFFTQIVGSNTGLFLFLRLIYLTLNAVAALLWYLSLRRTSTISASLGAVIVLSFIPFGLPAPSYNTLGLQSLVVALAAYRLAMDTDGVTANSWSLATGIAWATATVAYPPLAVAAIGFCLLIGFFARPFTRSAIIVIAVAASVVIAWATVFAVLGPERILRSVAYLALINDAGGAARKFAFSIELLLAHPIYSTCVVAALILGVFRSKIRTSVFAVLSTAILAAAFAGGAVAYATSHDIIAVLTALGVGYLLNFRRVTRPNDAILAITFASSLLAALVTTASATNAIYNFCLGATPAAAMLFAPHLAGEGKSRRWMLLPGMFATLAILSTSLFSLYGELPMPPEEPRVRITSGIFAGLSVTARDWELIAAAEDLLTGSKPGQTIAVVGRTPGLALLADQRLVMPTAYPLTPGVSEQARLATEAFFAANRPDVVLIYEDAYLEPINPFGAAFGSWYSRDQEVATPLGRLTLYSLLN